MIDLKNRKTAIALGNFDGLHKGHIAVINNAVNQNVNGLLPCVLIFDEHPQQILSGKSPKQLLTYKQFEIITAEMGCDILHIPFDDVKNMSPEEFIKEILIDRMNVGFISCGFNYRFGKNGEGDISVLSTLCRKFNLGLAVTQSVEYSGKAISSTRIRKEIECGNITNANEMLGRCFSYDFEVVNGDHRGRTLGFPTINQFFPDNFVVPGYGVYASKTFADGKWYPSVTNIGIRPTIGNSIARSETSILGFSGDLYGSHTSVALLSYLRPEIKFNSLEELRLQIKKDSEKATEIFRQEAHK